MLDSISKRNKSQAILIITLLLLIILLNFPLEGRLLSAINIRTVLSNAVFPIFIAWGLSFVFTGGIIDLSIGANILLAANVGVLLAEKFHLGYAGLIIGAVMVSILIEQMTVHCSITLGIPSWISGLGVALVAEAILSQWSSVLAKNYAERLPSLKNYRILGQMPYMIILLIIGFIVAYIIFNKTKLGINLTAIGGNPEVAEIMGIDIKKTIILATIIGGVFIGMAGVINISTVGKMNATSGLSSLSLIFKSLAAVLLAQSIRNIFTTPVGILISGLSITIMFNILTLFGIPSGTWQEITLGIVIIACGILSNIKTVEVVK